MGLDWHSTIPMSHKDQTDYVQRHFPDELAAGTSLDELVENNAPRSRKPCPAVAAPRMKDLPDFHEKAEAYLDEHKRQAVEEAKTDQQYRNQRFIDYWQSRTLEEQMAEDCDKFFCDQCSLLQALQGADSQDSCFLGITVSSCDFRGKRISSDGVLGELADEAYDEHDLDEMLDYADRLENKLELIRKDGLLDKQSYEKYVSEYKQERFHFEPKLSRSDYARTAHWREQNIRDAVHWLRTCAQFGVQMSVSY